MAVQLVQLLILPVDSTHTISCGESRRYASQCSELVELGFERSVGR
eukprot:gene28316-35155_t